jgi:hypothetical protein
MTLLYIGIQYLIIAQTIPYRKLDSLSTVFSKYQLEANGYSYNDGSQNYEVSFPEQNFKIWAYNRKASYSIYKKWGDKEILASTDNIDLTKVDSIQWLNSWQTPSSEFLFVFRIYFPKNSLITQLFENGKLIKTINEGYIDYFIMFTNKPDFSSYKFMKFYTEFINLIYLLKEEKNIKTTFSLEQIKNDWIAAIDNKSGNAASEDFKSFITKYPKTLYSAYATKLFNLVKDAELKEQQKLDANRKFVNDIAFEYKFKKGLYLSQFIGENSERAEFLSNSKFTVLGNTTTYNSKMKLKNFVGNPWTNGLNSISVDNRSNTVITCTFNNTGEKNETFTSYQNFVNKLKKNLAPEYVLTKNNGYEIRVPGAETYLDVYYLDTDVYNKWALWYIVFYCE